MKIATANIKRMTPKEKGLNYLSGKGRWTNEDLYLIYTEEVMNDDKLTEHCINLWYEFGQINKALDIALEEQKKEILKIISDMQEKHNVLQDKNEWHEGYDTAFWDITNKINEKLLSKG